VVESGCGRATIKCGKTGAGYMATNQKLTTGITAYAPLTGTESDRRLRLEENLDQKRHIAVQPLLEGWL